MILDLNANIYLQQVELAAKNKLVSDWLLDGSLRANALQNVKRLARSEWSGFLVSPLYPVCVREVTALNRVPWSNLRYEKYMKCISIINIDKIYEIFNENVVLTYRFKVFVIGVIFV